MRVVCSYCRIFMRNEPSAGYGVSHGMCPECDAYFERLWGGMALNEYLEELPHPVVLMNEQARVVAANSRAEGLVGCPARELRGLLGGEALACTYSRLPEGCGKTEHCRECTIRNSVEQVHRTGVAVHDVTAYLNTADGRMPLRISVEPDCGFYRVTVEPG
jgi:hypothetical protein